MDKEEHLRMAEDKIILEQGNIYFFSRPRVQSKAKAQKTEIKNVEEVQRFYFVLHPEKNEIYRVILIGTKKLPTIDKKHEKNWAAIDFITLDKGALFEEFKEKTYSTSSRGKRFLPAMQMNAEGIYCLFEKEKNTYLSYKLKSPKKLDETQTSFQIKPEASYIPKFLQNAIFFHRLNAILQ